MPFDCLYPTFFKVSGMLMSNRADGGWNEGGLGVDRGGMARSSGESCLAGGAEAPGVLSSGEDRLPGNKQMLRSCPPVSTCLTGGQDPHKKIDLPAGKSTFVILCEELFRSPHSYRSVTFCFQPTFPAIPQATDQQCLAARGQPEPKLARRRPRPPRYRPL